MYNRDQDRHSQARPGKAKYGKVGMKRAEGYDTNEMRLSYREDEKRLC
jgi:hypothetical protein